MSETLCTAGESASLRWLVGFCLESSPWLRLDKDRIVIDWQLAFSHWQQLNPDQLLPDNIHAVMPKLMPYLSLSLVQKLSFSASAAGHMPSLSADEQSALRPISKDLLEAMTKLGALCAEILVMVDKLQPSAKRSLHSFAGRQPGDNVRRYLEVLSRACGIRYLSYRWYVEYHIGYRLLPATGDVSTFLRGIGRAENDSSLNSEANQDQVVQIARRLVRAHSDLYAWLEQILLRNFDEQSLAEICAELPASWQQLAVIERALADALLKVENQPNMMLNPKLSRFREDYLSYTSPDAQQPVEWSGASPVFQRVLKTEPSAFGEFLLLCENLAASSKELRRYATNPADMQRLEVFSESLDDVIAMLHRDNQPLQAEMSMQIDLQHINEAINSLIAYSPLLTLIASGFLSTYVLPKDPDGFGFCLSPWVTAIVLAQKQLGHLPLTHLGISESVGEQSDSKPSIGADDGEEMLDEGPQLLTGRRVWEAISGGIHPP